MNPRPEVLRGPSARDQLSGTSCAANHPSRAHMIHRVLCAVAALLTTGGRVALIAPVAFALKGLSGWGSVSAQTGPSIGEVAAAPRVGCFRGRPLPACRSFWIVEMQGEAPVAQTTRTITFTGELPREMRLFEKKLEWNLGHMLNLTPRHAVGGVLTFGTSNQFGVKLRGRRWLNADLSVELEGGLLTGMEVHYVVDPGGRRTVLRVPDTARSVTGDARLNIRDQGYIYVRWDGVQVPPEQDPTFLTAEGGFQQALSVGAGLGSVPALVGTGALGIGSVIFFMVLLLGGRLD